MTIKDLINNSEKLNRKEIECFWHEKNKNGYLSQWYESEMIIDGVTYSCAEQYMMAEKARLFNDDEVLYQIMKKQHPAKYKALGRKIKNFNAEKWDKHKEAVVFKANLNKFNQNEELKRMLISTGDKILIEASPYDTIWGVGLKSVNDDILYPEKWNGLNLLGFILMKVRNEIVNQK